VDRGPHPVGPDHQVGLLDPPVGELQHDRIGLLDDVHQPAAQVQVLGAERGAEGLLRRHGGCEVWRAEALQVPVAVPHRVRRDPAAVPPVPVDQLGRDGGHTSEVVGQAEPPELPDGVGGQRDRRADLGELRGLLEDAGDHAPFPQRQCEGQAPHARSDDGDAQLRSAQVGQSRLLLSHVLPLRRGSGNSIFEKFLLVTRDWPNVFSLAGIGHSLSTASG
jgi:hypothetical protein